jgi:signal transduction histidine kinase
MPDFAAGWHAMGPMRRYLVVALLAFAAFAVATGLWAYGHAAPGAASGTWAQSWLILLVLAGAMLAVPFFILQSAVGLIEEQRRLIAERREETSRLVAQRDALRKLTEIVHRRGMEHNERLLRRIGSDLHDGPAQHLALVLLRLDALSPTHPAQSGSDASPEALETIRRATSDALKEIRHISAGLALPELQKISLADALQIAVRAHQRATGTPVESAIDRGLPVRLPLPMTICLYRFAQEALNNAFRHAGGKGQRLRATCDGGTISVEVADNGPGFVLDQVSTGDEHLGLSGLRYRIESVGGSLRIDSVVGEGTKLTAQFRNPLA